MTRGESSKTKKPILLLVLS
jgi:hypothetical protein